MIGLLERAGGQPRRQSLLHGVGGLHPGRILGPHPAKILDTLLGSLRLLMALLVQRWIQQLQAQQEDHEQRAHNLPRLALREPAVDPGKDGAHHQDVEGRKSRQRQCRPGKELRPRHRDAHQDAQAAQRADDGGDIRQPKDHIQQIVRSEAHREAQQDTQVKLFLKRGQHHRTHLPEDARHPEDGRQELPLFTGNQCISARTHDGAQPQPHEGI